MQLIPEGKEEQSKILGAGAIKKLMQEGLHCAIELSFKNIKSLAN
jgi:hypothetical protein